MPRTPNIRWRSSDEANLKQSVKKFNSKVRRLAKSKPDLAPFLPKPVSYKQIRNNITTRADLNRDLNSLNRFLKPGSETPLTTDRGLKTTKWQKNEVALKVAQINRNRTRELKESGISTYKGTMNAVRQNNLNPKSFNIENIAPDRWNKYIQNVEKQVRSNYNEERNKMYVQNYLVALDNELGIYGEEIKAIVSTIEPDKFIQMYYDDPVLQIDFVYSPYEQEMRANQIISHLNANGYSSNE